MDVAERRRQLRVALTLLEDGQHAKAEALCRQLVAHGRNDIEVLLLLGLAIGLRGDADAAAQVLNRVAHDRPSHAHPCSDLARLLLSRSNAALIAPQYLACLKLMPDDLRLRYAFAEFLRETGEASEAIPILDVVLLAHPDNAEAHYQMGMALAEAARFDGAAEQFRQAIDLDPEQAAFWSNLGTMLKVEGRFDEALDAYGQALARSPGDRQVRVNRAVARLHAGRFAEAWQDEDWVLAEPGRIVLPSEKLLPPLSVLPDLTGRTVLVVQEEGLGDTLQFLRYLPLLAKRGAHVAVAIPPELTRLVRTVSGVAEVPPGMRPCHRTIFTARSTGFRARSRRRWRPFRVMSRISPPIRHSWPIGPSDCRRRRRCVSGWYGPARRGPGCRASSGSINAAARV
jgi:Flp pilus assembly protein TadD